MPALIVLQGNGGSAKRYMMRFLNPNGLLHKSFIRTFPQGYRKSWNIACEASKADDLSDIEAVITELSRYDNVQQDNFSILGNSNGAALVNQIAIETTLASIRNYISFVSPLNGYQHDDTNSRKKNADNEYSEIAKPRTGIRLMNVSGTNDKLVPYAGGPSARIPAKGGKLPFVDAEQSIYLWAKHMGYAGHKLTTASWVNGNVEAFRYLGGDIIHYKVVGGGHGSGRAIGDEVLLEFLQSGNH